MNKLSKILFSIILIYEPLAYVLFVDYHNCRDIFSWQFCSDGSLGTRIVLFLIVPFVLAILGSIWSGGISKKQKNKNLKQKSQKIKQKTISPSRIHIKKIIWWYVFIIIILGVLLYLLRTDSEYTIDSVPYQIGQVIGNILLVGLLGIPFLGGIISYVKTEKNLQKNNKPVPASTNKNETYGWQNWE